MLDHANSGCDEDFGWRPLERKKRMGDLKTITETTSVTYKDTVCLHQLAEFPFSTIRNAANHKGVQRQPVESDEATSGRVFRSYIDEKVCGGHHDAEDSMPSVPMSLAHLVRIVSFFRSRFLH